MKELKENNEVLIFKKNEVEEKFLRGKNLKKKERNKNSVRFSTIKKKKKYGCGPCFFFFCGR